MSWSFPPGASYDQRILQSPSLNVTIEEGPVPQDRRFIVTGLYRRAWVRTLSGDGSAFGICFRPAGFLLLHIHDFRLAVGETPRAYLRSIGVPSKLLTSNLR